MKIDLHTHILPENWPDLQERYGYGGFVRLDHHALHIARTILDDANFVLDHVAVFINGDETWLAVTGRDCDHNLATG